MEKLKEIEWNYIPQTYTPLQTDWNQTLHTKINQIWATNKSGDKMSMIIPIKFKSLMESLEYYRFFDQKYNITFTDEDIDYINIDGCKLVIKNYQIETEGQNQ